MERKKTIKYTKIEHNSNNITNRLIDNGKQNKNITIDINMHQLDIFSTDVTWANMTRFIKHITLIQLYDNYLLYSFYRIK